MRGTLAVISTLVLVGAVGCGQETSTVSSSQAIEGGPCPAAWYSVTPDPSWGLPPTLGDMGGLVYSDSDFMGVYFLVPLAGLQSLLPASVHPVETSAGSGLGFMSIGFYNHRDPQYLAPYQEFGVSIPVYDSAMYEGYTPMFTTNLVVTTPDSLWSGQGWGLVKILGNVKCHDIGREMRKCIASADDQLIAKMDVHVDNLVPFVIPPYLSVSTRDGYLIRAPFILTGDMTASQTVGVATIKLGDHPLAQKLAAIGLGSLPSVLMGWAPHTAITLSPPVCAPL